VKTLIYFYERYIAPTGGPSGYLWNLKSCRDERSDKEISFLNEEDFKPFLTYRIRHKIHSLHNRKTELSAKAARISEILYQSGQKGPFDLGDYDIVHFHSTFDLYSQKTNLEDYHGKVILTSHTPKRPYNEYVEDILTREEYEQEKELFDRTAEFDEYAFRRADYIIFPCKDAEEPYYHTWDKYPDIRDERKYIYLPTGVPGISARKDASQVRRELGIPDNRFVICYVGRHIPVKGYDRLISIFGKLENVTVICCGRPGDIPAPESKDWIEIGWTDDPYSYINAADLFILPNRETYFDLSLLETISLGKRCLISLTGGNKTFAGREDCGIYTFSTEDEAAELIRQLMNDGPEVIASQLKAQNALYCEKYTLDIFYDRYKEILRRISNESR